MHCLKCQRENNSDYRFCIFCGSPLQAGETQELPEKKRKQAVVDANLDLATNYAGFQRRFVAWIIDAVILGALFAIMAWLWYITANPTDAQEVFFVYFVWIIASSFYIIGFWTWRGQTPGKMVMKVKIIRSDGRPFGISRVMLRFVGYIAPAIIMLILFVFISAVFRGIPGIKELRGLSVLVATYLTSILVILLPYWLTIALDRKKRGLHDRIARTYVVKTHQVKTPQLVNNTTGISDS